MSRRFRLVKDIGGDFVDWILPYHITEWNGSHWDHVFNTFAMTRWGAMHQLKKILRAEKQTERVIREFTEDAV